MHAKTLTELAAGLDSGDYLSVELTQALLDRIAAHDEKLNAMITVTGDEALAAAAKADADRAAGNAGTLCGLPLIHKDIFCTRGVRTSCGSKMLDNFVSPYDATVVERLAAAGAVMLGKANMDEFAMGSSNETSYYGPVRNPWDLDRSPGGSSGGSAASVAARFTPAATATDTGGSIRQPAALTNTIGIKPTYGRVSRYGMVAFASSLDQAGVITRTAEDAARLLGVMAGFDERDSTCLDEPVPDYAADLGNSIKGLKIGVVRQHFDEGLDADCGARVREAIAALESLGATAVEVDMPNIDLSVPTYYVVAPAECSSNLSRFDGVRFGHRAKDTGDLFDLYCRSRGEGFGDEVKRRIMTGTYVLSAGYYDAYYLKAQQVRHLIADDFKRAFEDVDVIAGPTSPTAAFKLGAKVDDPITMYLNDIYTIGANLGGFPAMSIPCGFVGGLPVGLHLVGHHFDESALLRCAHAYQQETDWHTRCPEGFA
ncbi:MAG: Asp-tRNA(Asn)/Glu-tRNA(Gln) amidotransferase subunit GatA [Gammaproteobacteria bacterium]|nr:Asp-tRNA(Asn)/Glu-tRNA(Gln) amidotransferase subunit GatA [Gammaproteobacteria bacterium]MBT8094734.1 Asp-tRNA(Asn)/Glu-tRNA(Gln) amidotransferase subunit GatA [Gammaproteobacteria bacterium]MBT8105564.1 Asp-tRNA(Asn)/Glu-tRNA(Gln) amidotransferase subunit GatA [Gammaproteobacteria bacterium]NNF50313.1 Asp-tRNA(Asn)/Glu-tRNA(Gln) amidotransferase subunit GatA [Woeseiaceae bacterium]NNK25578.1 Asp-tRNA(Asn)/Glu-tRNA(Gln) amidotransferase subunit GatA [Woeseiaceae bacterium]